MKIFEESFQCKLIYIFEIPDATHQGLLKIGDTTVKTTCNLGRLSPNCKILNDAARERINQYANPAGVNYNLFILSLHFALYRNVDGELKAFRDYAVHKVLLNSNIKKRSPQQRLCCS